jgi:LacI family transcriptional regulator
MGIDPGDPELRRLTRSDVPCVGVDVELAGPATSFVISDNVHGARLATEHLIEQGHRRIATICGLLDTRPGLDRLRGYRDALEHAGLAYRDEYVKSGDFYVESGHREAGRLLDLPEPPTAIVAAADLMAVGALQAAAARGLRVPEDVSIVGFDDIMLAAHLRPGLTTVRQDKAGLGAAAGRAVLAHVGEQADGAPAEDTTTLPVELVVRGTTGPVPAA